MDIIQKLMEKLETADQEYKDDIVAKIIDICSQGTYQVGYLSVLKRCD